MPRPARALHRGADLTLRCTCCLGCPLPCLSLPAHLLLGGNTRYSQRLCPLHLTLLGDIMLNPDPFYPLLPHRVLWAGGARWPQPRLGLGAVTSSGRAVVPCGWKTNTRPPSPPAGSHVQRRFEFTLSLSPRTGTLMPRSFSSCEAGVHPLSTRTAECKEATRHVEVGEDKEKGEGFISSIRSVTRFC